jgi:hypothetical protein
MSAATLHRLHQPEQLSASFTPSEREQIINQAKKHVAEAREFSQPPSTEARIDPLVRYRREANEAQAEREREDKQRRQQTRVQNTKQQTDAAAWSSFIATEIAKEIAAEREFLLEVVGMAIGDERQRITKLFEAKIAELKTEHAKQLGELRSELRSSIAKWRR